MRFFRNRKEQSSTDLKKNNGFDLNDCLDYFSKLDKVCNKIIEQERQVLNGIDSDLTSHEVDAVLNKSLILERAFEKYDSVEDFNLINAEWFPRLRTYKTRDKETESISSNDSDDYHDGFAGPFSWETKSQQQMIFPPTPENERKSASDENKFSKKKKKRMTNAGDEDLLSDHRTYETIEELRTRLMQNYLEAKQQREKYLNLKEKKTKEEMEEKSVNGKRNKLQSKTIFKNYKKDSVNKGSRKEPNDLSVGNTGPSIAINGLLNSSDPGSFDSELASALKKRNESLSDMSKKALTDRNNFSPNENHKYITEESVNGLSITRNYSTPFLETTETKFSHNNSSREDDLNLNIKGTEIQYSDINLNHSYSSSVISSDSKSSLAYSTDSTRTSPGPEEGLRRKNSSKRRKKSTDKRAGSIKRKNSNRSKSSSLSPSTNDISLLNKENVADEPKDTSLDIGDSGLTNVMDMLANW